MLIARNLPLRRRDLLQSKARLDLGRGFLVSALLFFVSGVSQKSVSLEFSGGREEAVRKNSPSQRLWEVRCLLVEIYRIRR